MTKSDFYNNKSLAETEWWLNAEWLPDLVWGRVRVYDDGTADALFAEGVDLYGFDDRESAGRFLAQDDLSRFADYTQEDVEEFGLDLSEIHPPTWTDPPDQEFIYIGRFPKAG